MQSCLFSNPWVTGEGVNIWAILNEFNLRLVYEEANCMQNIRVEKMIPMLARSPRALLSELHIQRIPVQIKKIKFM